MIISPAKRPNQLRCRLGCGLTWAQRTVYYIVVQIPPYKGAILRGKGAAHCKQNGLCAVSCAKTAELINVSFGMLSWGGLKEACVRWGCTLAQTLRM